MPAPTDSSARELLRHTVATLAYRAGKPLRDAPDHYATYRAAPDSRSAAEILAHLCDLLDWGDSLARGDQKWRNSTPGVWSDDIARFFAALRTFDDYLASDALLHATPEKLFQGPVADALQHVGQLTMLRRLAGSAIRGENYHRADISSGRVGADQAPPKAEFD